MNHSKKVLDKIISKTKIYLAIIALLMVVICIYNPYFIIPSVVIFILIVMYAYWTNNKRQEELTEHIKNLTFSLDKVAKIALVNSPFPLVIAETNGNLIFRNTKFNQEFANIDINNYLTNIVNDVKLQIKNNNKKEKIYDEIKIDKKTYKLYGDYMPLKDEYIIIIYFVDDTKLVELEDLFDNKDMYTGLVMIDNYEEIIQRLEDSEKTQLMAEIEKKLYDWASDYKGIILKSERDTFVCIFEKQYIKEIEDKKFDILDIIKDIQPSDRMQFTLSIAISNDGATNLEKYKTAQAALDIVLGRGGDQAVIHEGDKYKFFGGRTQELEKRTKVKARIVSHALEGLILESSKVIIMGHSNSDMDCVGSSMGIYRLAKTLEKDAYIVLNPRGDNLSAFLNELNQNEEYNGIVIDSNTALGILDDDTLLVVVDTNKKNYVESPELLSSAKKIMVVDHHRRSPDYIENATLTFHEVYASSASELVTELVEYAQKEVNLTSLEAEALYSGIMMDTKTFTFKTGVRTFEAAAYLRKCGVDIIKVKKWFQSDLDTYNKISNIIGRAELVYDTIAISIYDEEDKDSNVVCAKAADELLTISNITASFVIGRLNDKVCISGRSIGDINVQVILEKLGGGGHITLAGAQVEGMTIEEAKQELINRINEYFSEQNWQRGLLPFVNFLHFGIHLV